MNLFMRMTWVGWLNFILLQWFFVRLARVVDRSPYAEMVELILDDESLSMIQRVEQIRNILRAEELHPVDARVSWSILYPVAPLTGWWSDYWPIFRMREWKVVAK